MDEARNDEILERGNDAGHLSNKSCFFCSSVTLCWFALREGAPVDALLPVDCSLLRVAELDACCASLTSSSHVVADREWASDDSGNCVRSELAMLSTDGCSDSWYASSPTCALTLTPDEWRELGGAGACVSVSSVADDRM